MSDQEQYIEEAIADAVLIDEFDADAVEQVAAMEEEASLQPLIVPYNIDDLIAQHMLNLFNRYRDTDIPGTVELKISTTASSGAREIAVEHHCNVGTWQDKAEFKSCSLTVSFERAVARWRDQQRHAVKALPAS